MMKSTLSRPLALILGLLAQVSACAAGNSLSFSVLNDIDTSPYYGIGGPGAKRGAKGARKVANYVLDTRGTDSSKEGADVVLDMVSDVSSETTPYYRDQIHRDDLHWQAVCLMARIAGALGKPLTESDTMVTCVSQLRELVGDNATESIVRGLSDSEVEAAHYEMQGNRQFDLVHFLSAQDAMMVSALDHDSIIGSVRKDLQRYNGWSDTRRSGTKVLYTSLQVAGFMPNLLAPIAQTTMFGAVMANGGTEQDKLLKEVYYAKRFDKRRDLLRKQIELALRSRDTAIATRNPSLYHFAKELTRATCGDELTSHLFASEGISTAIIVKP
jgi:hypothetical protein